MLLPLAFCRECGQEYFPVRRSETDEGEVLEPREISDRTHDRGRTQRLPLRLRRRPVADRRGRAARAAAATTGWRPGERAVKRETAHAAAAARRRDSPTADLHGGGLTAVFIPAPFRFCLGCGVAYGGRQTADFGKLATLGAGGRSTSTTILGLSAVRELRREETLAPEARKLLSFTDNRQDASLQAGHFNDFVEISLLRAALYEAVRRTGAAGLRYDELPAAVFEALDL